MKNSDITKPINIFGDMFTITRPKKTKRVVRQTYAKWPSGATSVVEKVWPTQWECEIEERGEFRGLVATGATKRECKTDAWNHGAEFVLI